MNKTKLQWISVEDELPDRKEPIVYRRPNPRKEGQWHVGIAYWTVSNKWNPEYQSSSCPNGFTDWFSLPLDN